MRFKLTITVESEVPDDKIIEYGYASTDREAVLEEQRSWFKDGSGSIVDWLDGENLQWTLELMEK